MILMQHLLHYMIYIRTLQLMMLGTPLYSLNMKELQVMNLVIGKKELLGIKEQYI